MAESSDSSINPYLPPSSPEDSRSLIDVIVDLFTTDRHRKLRRFLRGHAILFHGISFFIDPENDSFLYAASPSEDKSDQRMNLVVAEVVRVLPEFVSSNSYLDKVLVNRKVVVRMIHSYYDNQKQFDRETILDWDLLN